MWYNFCEICKCVLYCHEIFTSSFSNHQHEYCQKELMTLKVTGSLLLLSDTDCKNRLWVTCLRYLPQSHQWSLVKSNTEMLLEENNWIRKPPEYDVWSGCWPAELESLHFPQASPSDSRWPWSQLWGRGCTNVDVEPHGKELNVYLVVLISWAFHSRNGFWIWTSELKSWTNLEFCKKNYGRGKLQKEESDIRVILHLSELQDAFQRDPGVMLGEASLLVSLFNSWVLIISFSLLLSGFSLSWVLSGIWLTFVWLSW